MTMITTGGYIKVIRNICGADLLTFMMYDIFLSRFLHAGLGCPWNAIP